MCVLVYLGVDGELEGFSDPRPGEFGLDPTPDVIPPPLKSKAKVYVVCQRGTDSWCCSCNLYHHHLPWEEEPTDPDVLSAYETLRSIVSEAQSKGLKPVLFSSWNGEEVDKLRVTWTLATCHLVPEHNLLEEYEKTGGALPPPTLILFDENAATPRAEYTW